MINDQATCKRADLWFRDLAQVEIFYLIKRINERIITKMIFRFHAKIIKMSSKIFYETGQKFVANVGYSRVNFLGTHFLGTKGIFEKNLMLTF